jgi:hypothetical protein
VDSLRQSLLAVQAPVMHATACLLESCSLCSRAHVLPLLLHSSDSTVDQCTGASVLQSHFPVPLPHALPSSGPTAYLLLGTDSVSCFTTHGMRRQLHNKLVTEHMAAGDARRRASS